MASAPVWLVIASYAAMKAAYVGLAATGLAPERFAASDFAKHNLDNSLLVAGICLSIVYTWVTGRMGAGAIWRVMWQKDMYQNLMIGVGIIVFAGVLGASGAASRVAEDLERMRIPLWLVAMVLPFTVGVITGITMNMVVLTYPIVLLALKGAGQEHLAIPYCCLAFAAGYAGVLITPLHICMLQSNAYFGLGATATLRRLAAPTALTVVVGAGLFLCYVAVFPHVGWGPGSHVIPEIGFGR